MNVAFVEAPIPREAVPQDLLPKTLEALRAFVGLSAKTATPPDTTILDLFGRIAQINDQLFVMALEKRTASEFRDTATAVFNDYIHVLRAKSDLLRVVLKNDSSHTEVLIHQSLSELEAEFRAQGVERFGNAVNEQAVFTIWILRKTTEHIWRLREPDATSIALDEEQRKKLESLGSDFALYSAWAQFHLGCLTASMRLDQPLYPGVIPAMMDGLRAMVNANAYARQIVELYVPSVEDDALVPYAWDEEDEELMQSSMRDIDMESDGL
jgi:hypothetical protein